VTDPIEAFHALVATLDQVGLIAIAILALLVALFAIWKYGGSG